MIEYLIDVRRKLERNPYGGPNSRRPTSEKDQGVIIHWTGPTPVVGDSLTKLKGYAHWHAEEVDWAPEVPGDQEGDGIMYHIGVDQAGLAYLLRDLTEDLWHCGAPENHTAFSVLGMIGRGQRASLAMLRTLGRVCDDLLGLNRLPRSLVKGHQEVFPNECPGSLMDDFVRPYRAGGVAAPSVDERLEREYQRLRSQIGEKRHAATIDRPYWVGKVIVAERGVVGPDGEITASIQKGLVDDWQTYLMEHGRINIH